MEMDARSQAEDYRTPSTFDLLDVLLRNRCPTGPFNEVWPNIIISNASTAKDKAHLRRLGVSHVLNAAHGEGHIDTGAGFYSDLGILYHGVEAPDSKHFNLSPFFHPAADFIHKALSQKGRVLVHCARGVSRSATLVLAYLMIWEHLTLMEATVAVCKHRNVLPNAGFLQQLCCLDRDLALERGGGS